MSFKNFFLFIAITSALLLLSCEDNKKASEVKKVNEIAKDSVPIEKKDLELHSEVTKKHPKITNDNVVEFLTHYGKENPETNVRITTQQGNIDLQLFKDTPLHRANFIYLVKQKYFDGNFFHRVVPKFIIQAGNSDLRLTPKKRAAIGHDYLLPAELDNKRKHTYGTISGAKEYRENPDKKSAPFEFFIFLGPQTSTGHLNGSYTIFGKVTKGMDVVEKIANLPSDEGDWPLQNVYITAQILE
jgi:peptidylprolyl isomerase